MTQTVATEQFEVWLTQERLREVLSYDPATGEFTFRVRVARRIHIGDIAGSINSEGYRHIKIDGRPYKAHRLAFLYMTGAWPPEMVDHIDGQCANNSWSNLRLATRSQNLANSTLTRRGKLARKGVSLRSCGRWAARIQRDNRSRFLGTFPTEHEAAAAYDAAAQELFGDYAKGAIA